MQSGFTRKRIVALVAIIPFVIKRDDHITTEQLHTVLLHLHDLGFLASQPIVEELVYKMLRTPETSGLHLRNLLLELIERLKPTKPFDIVSPEWRHFVILSDRYTKQRPLWEIQQKLALGERQMRREHQRALAALSMLVDAHQLELIRPSAPAATTPHTAPLAEAVQRLTPAPSFFELLDLVEDISHILSQTRITRQNEPPTHFQVHIDPPTLKIFTDRGILHQLLLKLAQLCTQNGAACDAASISARQEFSSTQTPDHRSAESDEPSTTGYGLDQKSRAIGPTQDNGKIRIRFESLCEPQNWGDRENLQFCRLLANALGSDLDWHDNSVSFLLPAEPRTRTVLIVDDEPSALELFRSYLSGLSYEVITESKAENVLPSVAANRPDLVILDVMMPAMDGWEVLQRLRHMPTMHDVPIVACSVLNDAELAYALGAAHFLKKPVLRHQLIRVVNQLLGMDGNGIEIVTPT
jgi:CheY-like chemotaxis protein